jgi:hypothetical protein
VADHFGVDLREEAAHAATGVEDVGDTNEHLGELPLLGRRGCGDPQGAGAQGFGRQGSVENGWDTGIAISEV